MSVYVDGLDTHPPPKDAASRRAGARHEHRWCHLVCDPGEEVELHTFAARIGLKRAWFQSPPKASKPHYDLTPPRRAAALAAGAVELDREGLRAFFARWRALP
ncbi:DUF4031 domain-containing protein [Myxococcus sp. CA040A]|uniref:DUF4031 domain-containing protein n=1 Tax=Myxococcus sp. CA040A TaxID=2741738 RepID=UPI00157B6F5F|nr:DUF4031 domain-containing protein [Myxococcus sp. CA040A]